MASMDVSCLPKKSNKLGNNTVSYKTILSVSTDYRDYRLGRKKTTCRYELLGSWLHCLSTLWYYIVLRTYLPCIPRSAAHLGILCYAAQCVAAKRRAARRRCTGQYVRRQPTATKLYQAGLQWCVAPRWRRRLSTTGRFHRCGWMELADGPAFLACSQCHYHTESWLSFGSLSHGYL